jgi:hypothetical protein
VWIVAPVFVQAKQIYWQLLNDLARPLIENINVNEGIVYLINGVQIAIKGSDRPDTMLGVGLFDVILDEFSYMKPEVWERILRPTLSDVGGRALFIGTPSGRNHFYKVYSEALEDQSGDWAAFTFSSADNPFIPAGEIDAARRSMSSSMFRQEYEASFETGGSGLFKPEWFKYAEEYPIIGHKTHGEPEYKYGEWLLTVDLHGLEEAKNATTSRLKRLDETQLIVTKIQDDGSWFVDRVYHGRWGVKEIAERIVGILANQKRPIAAWGMEKGTLLNAVMPYVREEAGRRSPPVPVNPTPLSHQNKSKIDRIRWALEGRLEHGQINFRTAEWNKMAEDQIINFPSKLVHDDFPDALALTDQLAATRTFADLSQGEDERYWEPMDDDAGF